ncbi:hypothetical protein C8Q73DRAFT_672425 [Cubamyces lactineus]|nr:hypothetical protein C8Q73DRAFT_672425 [Cubamyces lactineus]
MSFEYLRATPLDAFIISVNPLIPAIQLLRLLNDVLTIRLPYFFRYSGTVGASILPVLTCYRLGTRCTMDDLSRCSVCEVQMYRPRVLSWFLHAIHR